MPHKAHIGAGSLSAFSRTVAPLDPQRVFLVAGRHAYSGSGAESILASQLENRLCHRFDRFTPNPQLADIMQGCVAFKSNKPDLILAIGGGSAIDVAKFINLFAAHTDDPIEILGDPRRVQRKGAPLVVVPTTAGSGSEATQFGVLYDGKTKQSFSHPYLLPDIALLDPDLLRGLAPYQMAVSGMDALSQAVESFWGIQADEASRAHARMAIELALAHLEPAVRAPTDADLLAMSKAAYLAGKAINTTRTSGPHAFSYNLTAHFQVPHGHAVALTLGEFLVYNSLATDQDTIHPAGLTRFQQTMAEVMGLLGAENARAARDRWKHLMQTLGLATSLSQLGICAPQDLSRLRQGINPERMANHPRRVTDAFLHEMIDRIA